jgi:uncharacterized membrane protein YidH (DUF202 family)
MNLIEVFHSFNNHKNGIKKKSAPMSAEESARRLKRIDRLALNRTHMANERTFLAYVRTAFSLILIGIALVRFFEDPFFVYLGLLSLVGATAILIVGVFSWRFKHRSIISQAREK